MNTACPILENFADLKSELISGKTDEEGEPRGKQKKSVKKAAKEFVKKIRESLEKNYVFSDVYRMDGVDGYVLVVNHVAL